MNNTKANNYICTKCGYTGRFPKKPNFCPNCGIGSIQKNDFGARKHASKIIAEMQEITPELKKSWENYVSNYVEFENRRRLLEGYARRGIIEKSEIPTFKKEKLIDALYKYREERKKEVLK